MDVRFFSFDQMGEIIRTVRKSKGIKIYEVAEQAKMTIATVSNIETGKRFPEMNTLKKLVKVLGINLFFGMAMDENDFTRLIDAQRFKQKEE